MPTDSYPQSILSRSTQCENPTTSNEKESIVYFVLMTVSVFLILVLFTFLAAYLLSSSSLSFFMRILTARNKLKYHVTCITWHNTGQRGFRESSHQRQPTRQFRQSAVEFYWCRGHISTERTSLSVQKVSHTSNAV